MLREALKKVGDRSNKHSSQFFCGIEGQLCNKYCRPKLVSRKAMRSDISDSEAFIPK